MAYLFLLLGHTFFCFVDHASLYNLVNRAKLVHNFSYYVYFFSLHVSGDYVPIIKRNNRIYATLGICHSEKVDSLKLEEFKITAAYKLL